MRQLKGITWDSPRGFQPLRAWSAQYDQCEVVWDVHPLEMFESHPIADLARDYDLLVVDHPGIGEAVAEGCLHPLETFLSDRQIRTMRQRCVGKSMDSYWFQDRYWAIPIDAAATVCAVRSDFDGVAPATWDDVLQIAQAHPGAVALSLAGPHALLTYYVLCLGLAGKLFPPGEGVIDARTGQEAYVLMSAITAQQEASLAGLNPIGLLEAMQAGRFQLCPVIFGYVNYAATNGAAGVRFTDAPHFGDSCHRPSILGGTGIVLSNRCEITQSLVGYLTGYVSDNIQSTLVVREGGQPAMTSAWHDRVANEATGEFFRNTIETVSQAHVRPNYPGYIPFQMKASALVRSALQEHMDFAAFHARLNELYRLSLPKTDAEVRSRAAL